MSPLISILQVKSYEELCQDNNATGAPDDLAHTMQLIEEAQTLECKIPKHTDPRIDRIEFLLGGKAKDSYKRYPFKSRNLYSLPGASLISPAYAVMSHDRYLIRDSYFNDRILMQTGQFQLQSIKLNLDGRIQNLPFALFKNAYPKSFVDETCYLPLYYWHFNYYHWIIEILPLIIEYLNDRNFKDCKIILPSKMNKFQREAVDLLNIPNEKIFYFDGNHTQFSRLLVPTLGNMSPTQLSQVRKAVFSKLGISTMRPGKRYYITRRNTKERQVLNEEDLISILNSFGFEIVDLDGVDFLKQVEMFSQAACIMGPHGAGLSNCVFAPPECTVVEFMPDDQVNQCFWVLANSLGMKYTYLTGEKKTQERHFTVRPEDLRILLLSLA